MRHLDQRTPPTMSPGLDLITDIGGLHVGNAHDPIAFTGVTVVVPERPVVAAVDVRGGAPGTRETDALGLGGIVEDVHAVVLSGGSAFGLDAAGAVQEWLAAQGKGFAVGAHRVPVVPQAILFDLSNGGDKSGSASGRYRRLALDACAAADRQFALGSAGAGYGATTATFRGGLGSASAVLDDGTVVGALVAANPLGSATVGEGPHFWAAPFETAREFGGHGLPSRFDTEATKVRLKGEAAAADAHPTNTTIAVVATSARLSKPECQRLAVMAQTGMARAIHPVHTPLDGDTVFALATGGTPRPSSPHALARLGTAAALCLARSIARAVYEAAPVPAGWTGPPAYGSRHPRSSP